MSTTSRRPFVVPSLPGKAVATAVAMTTILAFIYLLASRAGFYGEHIGVDWSHHMATLDVMYWGGSPADHWPQLGEFMGYPRSAYWPPVWISRLFSISTLQSFQIVGALSTFATIALSALILVRIIGYQTRGSVAGLIAAFAILCVFATLGLTHYANLAFNAFYTQSVATAVALASFWLLQILAGRSHLLAIAFAVPTLSAVTASFHLTPALWLAGSGLALVLSCRAPLHHLVLAALTVTALGAAAIYLTPGTAMTLEVAATANGAGTVAANGFLIGDRLAPMLGAYVVVGLTFLTLTAMAWRKTGWKGVQDEVLSAQAGTIGLLGVASLLVAQLAVTDLVGYYSLAKYASLCSVFAALTIGCLVREASRYVGPRWNERPTSLDVAADRPFKACLAVVALFLAQGFHLPSSDADQSRMIALQATDTAKSLPFDALVHPVLDVDQLSVWEEYYFAISILAYPRSIAQPSILNGEALGGPFDERIIHPAGLQGLIEPWSGQRLRVSDPTSERFLMSRLARGPIVPWGRWVVGRRLEYLGQVASGLDANGVCLETVAPRPQVAPATRTLIATFNSGGGSRTVTFDDEMRRAVVFVPLPAPMPSNGEFVLAIENVENALGPIASDSSEIGVGLVAMWLAQSSCE